MDLKITFEPEIGKASNTRLILSVGSATARSYPMGADDHYRDLVALRHFLGPETLSSIHLGDEPVAAIDFSPEDDLVTLRPYGRCGEKPVSGDFNLKQALRHIGNILDVLAAHISSDRATLDKQVAEDISAGVYDVGLSNRVAIG